MVEGRGSIFKSMGWEAVTGKECLRRPGGGGGRKGPIQLSGAGSGEEVQEKASEGEAGGNHFVSCRPATQGL